MDLNNGVEGCGLHVNSNKNNYPSSLDWRERGFVTEVCILLRGMLLIYKPEKQVLQKFSIDLPINAVKTSSDYSKIVHDK